MREPVNLYDVALEHDTSRPPGFRRGKASIGPSLGAEMLGATVYEIATGETSSPYHYEQIEEEWLIVLAGTPTLRDPDGEHLLAVGDVVCFPVGPEGAHTVTNRAAEPARIVLLSTIPHPDISICVYPDSGKLSVYPPGKTFRFADAVGYWDGEADPAG